MAGDWHESIVNLLQGQPKFAAALAGIAKEGYYGDSVIVEAETRTNAVGSKATTERRADSVTSVTLDFGEVKKLILITEVQRKWSDEKLRRLPSYMGRVFEDHEDCYVDVLMICPTDKLANRYRQGVRVNQRLRFVPLTLSPRDVQPFTSPDQPGATAEMATLALCLNPSPNDRDSVIRTADELLGTIEVERAKDYLHMLLQILDDNAREILEGILKTMSRPYHSEFTETFVKQGLEQGLERGIEQGQLQYARRSVIEVFEARSLELDPSHRELIEQCIDLEQLDRWHRRAIVAPSAAEVFAES